MGIITIQLGEESWPMDFTRSGLFEHIESAVGIDPFEWSQKFKVKENGQENGQTSILTTLKDVTVLAYAGINSYRDVKDLDAVPFEKVKRMVRSIPRDDLGKILTAFFEGFAGEKEDETKGELMAPQQSGQT